MSIMNTLDLQASEQVYNLTNSIDSDIVREDSGTLNGREINNVTSETRKFGEYSSINQALLKVGLLALKNFAAGVVISGASVLFPFVRLPLTVACFCYNLEESTSLQYFLGKKIGLISLDL
jgi:hypothetical protein